MGLSDHFDRLVGKYDGYASLARSDEIRCLLTNQLGGIASGKALDIGTGTGNFGSLLRASGLEVFGLDINHEMLRNAKSKGIIPVQAMSERLPFRESSFDIVSARQVFQYLTPRQFEDALSGINFVLKKEGFLVLDQISASSAQEAAVVASFMSVVDHQTRFLDINELVNEVESAGFIAVKAVLHRHRVLESVTDFCSVRNLPVDQYPVRVKVIDGVCGFDAHVSDLGVEYDRTYAFIVAKKE